MSNWLDIVALEKHLAKKAIITALLIVSSAAAALATDIIPCEVGNKWQYDCYKTFVGKVVFRGRTMASLRDASFGSSVYEVLSVDSKSAQPVYDYRETTKTTSSAGGNDIDEQTDMKILNTDTGQMILSTYQTTSNADEPEKQTYEPSLLYFFRNAAPDKQWTVGTMRDGDTSAQITAKAVGRETVTVPAGTFKDCIKVIYSGDAMSGTVDVWNKQFNITSGRSRGIYWIADGVGVVKELEVAVSVAETPGPDGKSPLTIDSALCSVSELRPGYTIKK